MSLPIVAVIGRPNVGKSSFFNIIAGERISIVDPTPGATRDRLMTAGPMGPREFLGCSVSNGRVRLVSEN